MQKVTQVAAFQVESLVTEYQQSVREYFYQKFTFSELRSFKNNHWTTGEKKTMKNIENYLPSHTHTIMRKRRHRLPSKMEEELNSRLPACNPPVTHL